MEIIISDILIISYRLSRLLIWLLIITNILVWAKLLWPTMLSIPHNASDFAINHYQGLNCLVGILSLIIAILTFILTFIVSILQKRN